MNPAIATITIFALVVTKVTDHIRNVFDPADRAAPWVWQTVALVIGLAIAFVWGLNALDGISHTPAQGYVGQVLTGFAMAAAGSGWHEIFDAFSGVGKKARAKR